MHLDTATILSENINDIEIVKKLIILFESYSDDNEKLLMKFLKDCKYNINVCEFLLNKKLKDENIMFRLELAKLYIKYNYSKRVFKILLDSNVKEYRSINELKTLLEALSEVGIDEYSYRIIINRTVLESKTVDEQIRLMKFLKTITNKLKSEALDIIIANIHLINHNLIKLINVFRNHYTKGLLEFINGVLQIDDDNFDKQIIFIERLNKIGCLNEHTFNLIKHLIDNEYDYNYICESTHTIDLARLFRKCDYNVYVEKAILYLTSDVYIDDLKEVNDLIKILVDSNCNPLVFSILVESDIFENRTPDELITLIKILKQCDYNISVYELIIDYDLLKCNIYDQICIIETFIRSNYSLYAKTIVDLYAEKSSISELICIMNNLYEENVITNREIISNIKSLDEFKKYLKDLKNNNGENADIKLDSPYVPTFKKY